MKDALAFILSSIVENPDKIKINESEEDGIITFTISVAKEDIGRVIGKNGKIIRAIRNVLKIPAIKQGRRININLTEDSENA